MRVLIVLFLAYGALSYMDKDPMSDALADYSATPKERCLVAFKGVSNLDTPYQQEQLANCQYL